MLEAAADEEAAEPVLLAAPETVTGVPLLVITLVTEEETLPAAPEAALETLLATAPAPPVMVETMLEPPLVIVVTMSPVAVVAGGFWKTSVC